MPQFKGKEEFDKLFETCHYPKSDQDLIKNFELPSHVQPDCFTRSFFKSVNMVKADDTVDTEKMAMQFTDYGKTVPAGLKKFGEYNIYKETSGLTEELFTFMKKYKDDFKYVFYGNAHETFV